MERIGDLIPAAARRLGLEEELRLARAVATWDAIVGERVPAASGSCRLVRVEGRTLVVDADEPIVAQELRMRSPELLAAFRDAPGGTPVANLRVEVRRV
jgi:predicted nucleic acid-binding Zn ribbon protein